MNLSKYIFIILVFTGSILFSISCGSDYKSKPASTYMPDMYVSRALETYASLDYLHEQGISFDYKPVEGTIKRGDYFPYHLKNDEEGYLKSAEVKNPLPQLNEKEVVEAERLYLINCGICHGTALDGNGPLYKSGEGPYIAKPATLVGDAKYESMAEGTMYHSMLYGKNLMGSYASQLSAKQRWMIVHYIKLKQSQKK